MEHASETLLGLHALDPALVPRRDVLEAHLGSCGRCRAALEHIRADDAALREPETWIAAAGDADPRARELRAFFVRAAQEDAAAVELLKEFEHPDAAASFVWEDVARKPEYRTGGVARRLCKLANGMCERHPLYALSLAEAATRIARLLPEASYPRSTIHELRGEAWKEQANASRFLGRFADALKALDVAEDEYRKLPYEGIGLVAVKYVHAYVLFEQDQFDEAEALAQESACEALHLGETDRYMRARHLQGEILVEKQQPAAAATLFADAWLTASDGTIVAGLRESLALGVCHIALSDARTASNHLYRALRIYSDLHAASEVARTNWNIARMHFLQGGRQEATYKLRTVIGDLTGFGMLTTQQSLRSISRRCCTRWVEHARFRSCSWAWFKPSLQRASSPVR